MFVKLPFHVLKQWCHSLCLLHKGFLLHNLELYFVYNYVIWGIFCHWKWDYRVWYNTFHLFYHKTLKKINLESLFYFILSLVYINLVFNYPLGILICCPSANFRRDSRFELTTLVVIATDCTGSCKSNYHTITTDPGGKGQWKSHIVYLENKRSVSSKKGQTSWLNKYTTSIHSGVIVYLLYYYKLK